MIQKKKSNKNTWHDLPYKSEKSGATSAPVAGSGGLANPGPAQPVTFADADAEPARNVLLKGLVLGVLNWTVLWPKLAENNQVHYEAECVGLG